MRFLKSFKRFTIYLTYSISKSFLFSQASFHNILKDSFFSKIRGLNKSFINIKNNIEISDKTVEQIKKDLTHKSISRAHTKTSQFSKYITFKKIPNFIKKILKENKKPIISYLGHEVSYEDPVAWRLFHIDQEFEGFDVFSNVWHQDSHDGNRLLKIFILIDKVEDYDGPFHWIDEKNTIKNWDYLHERWTFESFKETKIYSEQRKLIGNKGDYLILDTSRCMHRDSNPSNTRNIAQITLYPKWRNKIDRNIINLRSL